VRDFHHIGYDMLILVEESLEMSAVAVAVRAVLLHLAGRVGALELRFAPDAAAAPGREASAA
jgi:hypothetical protein